MKKLTTLLALAMALLSLSKLHAVELKDCPPPVTKTINDNLGKGESVTTIKLITEGQDSYYEVNTDQEGYMTVDPDGTLSGIDLGIEDVPDAVKTAIQANSKGKLDDIYMELDDNGKPQYEVTEIVQGSPVITKYSEQGVLIK